MDVSDMPEGTKRRAFEVLILCLRWRVIESPYYTGARKKYALAVLDDALYQLQRPKRLESSTQT